MIVGVTTIGKGVGATTVAAGLGAALGGLGASTVLVESDVGGGDLARIRGVDASRGGILGWVSGFGIDDKGTLSANVWSHPETPGCVLLPSGSAGSIEQFDQLWRNGLDELSSFCDIAVMDLGRWTEWGRRWWGNVDCGVVVASGSVAGLERTMAMAGSGPLAPTPKPVCAVVNGSGFSVEEIRSSTGIEWQDCLEWSKRDAERIRVGQWKRAKRSQLGRQLIEMAEGVADEWHRRQQRVGALGAK